MKEEEDFYFDADGNTVFTAEYHLKRGFCCKNACQHCPWNYYHTKKANTDETK